MDGLSVKGAEPALGQIVRNGHLRGQIFKFACVRGENVVRVAVLPGSNGWPEYRFQNWRLTSIEVEDGNA